MRNQPRSSAFENEEFTLSPAPADITQPVSVAESFGVSSRRSPRRAGRYGVAAEDTGDQYRLSPVPGDQEPAVAVAQGFDVRRAPRRSRAAAVVEIASAIVGAVMTRVLDNEGDISWELDQLNGVAHPDNATSSPSSSTYTSKRIPISGIYIENLAGDRITADFEITFQYNGASVGYIQVSNTGTNDAIGWGLTVKENIMADPNTYTSVPPDGTRFAGIKVRFNFRFDRSIGSDSIAIRELTLFGNGSVRDETRWTQS